MKKKTIRIGRNDPALAHALASAELNTITEETEKWIDELFESNSVKQFLRASRQSFKNKIIEQSQSNTRGSRAQIRIVAVDANQDKDFTLGIFRFDARMPRARRVSFEIPRLVVRHHAIARVMQRTTGQNKIEAVVCLLNPHLLAGYQWLKTPQDFKIKNKEIQFIGNGGALIGNIHEIDGELGLEFATWVDSENASDPYIKKTAFSSKIIIRTM
jgi:hypothetical protein